MTTIEVNILADDDQEFVLNILGALAQKKLIEFDTVESLPVEGPALSDAEGVARIAKAENGQRYSYQDAMTKLGL